MFKKVVWATDGSGAADEALPVAKKITAEAHGELVIVHCVELTVPGKASGRLPVYANEDELRTKVAQQAEQLTAEGVPARVRVTSSSVGDAAQVIAETAREEGAEVIVVGTRGRGPLAGLLLGSVTQRLLHVAPCPVLAVPTRHTGHEHSVQGEAEAGADGGVTALTH